MRKLLLQIAILLSISCGTFLFVTGCQKTIDPVTGKTSLSLDPNKTSDIQEGASAVSMALGILSIFWPTLLPVAGYIGGAVRISKKLTPQLTEAQSELSMFHTVASSTVLGVEEFKKTFPKEWLMLEKKLNEIKDKVISSDDRLKIENVILGLRGKPAKTI